MPDERTPYEHCMLCPRECGARRASGEMGACRSGAAPTIARASLHLWEEPPISGSAGSGTLFFEGCSLRCSYCQNHAISRSSAREGVDAPTIAARMLELQDEGAMNINLVTPTHFAPTIREAIALARGWGLKLPVLWNTSGYERTDAIAANAGLVDVYLTDFKYAADGLGRAYSNVDDYAGVALDALQAMVEHTSPLCFDEYGGEERLVSGVVVRHMILPGHADDSERVLETLFHRFGNSILYSIMNQYTPVLATAAERGDGLAKRILAEHPDLGRSVSDEEYEQVLDFADALGMEDYFWQDGATCTESFIPDFP